MKLLSSSKFSLMKQVKQSQQQPQVAKPTIVEADTQVNVNFSSICRCRFNFRFRFHFRLKLSPKLNGLTNLGGKMEFGRYIYISIRSLKVRDSRIKWRNLKMEFDH